ncbi:MAG TPA: hypothetical protein VH331_06775 [Allosphingosinicella sp.]|nr:hypothetical protein [Allosphingosinicella sp.]
MAFALAVQSQGTAQIDRFSWATSRERLGAELRSIEVRLGSPSTRSNSEAVFSIGSCRVGYWIDELNRIKRITAEVTAACHPSPEGVPITPAATFGALFRPGSHYGAECLGSCGSAETPTLVLTRVGRINQEESWSLFFHATDSAASEAWLRALPPSAAARVAAEGRLIDVGNPPQGVIPLLQQARIRRIELNLFRPHAPPVASSP